MRQHAAAVRVERPQRRLEQQLLRVQAVCGEVFTKQVLKLLAVQLAHMVGIVLAAGVAVIGFVGVEISSRPCSPSSREKPRSMALCCRSEERRVGKECVSTCRSRWWPNH